MTAQLAQHSRSTASAHATIGATDIGLLVLRLGVGAAVLQAGLIKAFDFSATVGFLAEAGWRLPTFAALMVTSAETLAGVSLLLGALTPLGGCAVLGAMLCAWAVNVSAAAFWSQPFNVPFLIGVGGAALIFTGAGGYALDRRLISSRRLSARLGLALLGLAFATAVLTWAALNGVNPIHFTAPEVATRPVDRATYPAVRIATVFRNATQRFLKA